MKVDSIEFSNLVKLQSSQSGLITLLLLDGAGNKLLSFGNNGVNPLIGFLGATAVARPTITGKKANGQALQNLLTALSNLGLIMDSTT